jgi:hypothetical protein
VKLKRTDGVPQFLRPGLLSVVWLLLATLPAFAQTDTGAAPAVDPVALERRLHQVNVLIESSSAARQVESSGNAAALDRREQARRVYRQAMEAFQAGQLVKSSQLLPEASVRMFEAVRMAAPEVVAADKARVDFDARMESVKSLLAAHKRIAAEKKGVPGAAETSATIEKLAAEATRQASAGDLTTARATLDRAYLIAKAAISSLRGGDTLVRSLAFTGVEDEYRYEVDRNDTHQMLVKVLLAEKRESAATDTLVKGFVDRAAELRDQAERAARGHDYHAAIRLLEQSTSELVRAIRGAGVYIPG